MEYTKGEWKVSKPFKEIPYSVSSNEKYPIARLGFTQEDETNAQLIASAPDLYEALKELVGICGEFFFEDQLEQSKKALNKAEGK